MPSDSHTNTVISDGFAWPARWLRKPARLPFTIVNDKHDEGVLSLNVMLGAGKKKLCGGRLSSGELSNALHFFL